MHSAKDRRLTRRTFPVVWMIGMCVDEFAAHGLVLAQRLKAELPGWTVVYLDEQKAATKPAGADRSYFEYEI